MKTQMDQSCLLKSRTTTDFQSEFSKIQPRHESGGCGVLVSWQTLNSNQIRAFRIHSRCFGASSQVSLSSWTSATCQASRLGKDLISVQFSRLFESIQQRIVSRWLICKWPYHRKFCQDKMLSEVGKRCPIAGLWNLERHHAVLLMVSLLRRSRNSSSENRKSEPSHRPWYTPGSVLHTLRPQWYFHLASASCRVAEKSAQTPPQKVSLRLPNFHTNRGLNFSCRSGRRPVRLSVLNFSLGFQVGQTHFWPQRLSRIGGGFSADKTRSNSQRCDEFRLMMLAPFSVRPHHAWDAEAKDDIAPSES
ncbi:hypothetical protein BJX68DRAFT_148286 [Aspergillus pseudodeflectus]|uniref:Uncharacterized protein n=1 Tax=Aspergillus pseudodeflectus TaxID=176178 RepID=A0ABR4JWG1_9EURO